MKKTFTIRVYKDNNLKVGDKVRLVDGSGFTSIEDNTREVYIVVAYPNLTGSDVVLKELVAEVTEINITDKVCKGVLDNVYLQDIVVKIGEGFFRTSSGMVKSIKMKKWHYAVSTSTIWASFDFGTVEAETREEALEKAKVKLDYNFKKANDILDSCDPTIGFTINYDKSQIELEEIN